MSGSLKQSTNSGLVGHLLVDTHVHIYRSFDLQTFLEAAASNIRRNAAALGLSKSTTGCLMLSETREEYAFQRVRDLLTDGTEEWTLQVTNDQISLAASASDGMTMIVIAGQQIVTREGLEVLALGTCNRVQAGLPLIESLQAVEIDGGIPVVPWGFGKWCFGRGARIRDALQESPGCEWFLGDNANRPSAAPQPELFARAAERNVAVLPGSDPLPLPGHERRAGCYGLVLSGAIDRNAPGRGVKRLLHDLKGQPQIFGRRVGLKSFFMSQIGLRLRKHTRRRN